MFNFQDIVLQNLNEQQLKEINPIALAFIGDAVHTLWARDRVVKQHNLLVKGYHLKSSKYCSAKAQAICLDKLFNKLLDDEKDVAKRARNAKIHHSAKNADIETYKKATAYEAVIGYLYLLGKFERLKQVLNEE